MLSSVLRHICCRYAGNTCVDASLTMTLADNRIGTDSQLWVCLAFFHRQPLLRPCRRSERLQPSTYTVGNVGSMAGRRIWHTLQDRRSHVRWPRWRKLSLAIQLASPIRGLSTTPCGLWFLLMLFCGTYDLSQHACQMYGFFCIHWFYAFFFRKYSIHIVDLHKTAHKQNSYTLCTLSLE